MVATLPVQTVSSFVTVVVAEIGSGRPAVAGGYSVKSQGFLDKQGASPVRRYLEALRGANPRSWDSEPKPLSPARGWYGSRHN